MKTLTPIILILALLFNAPAILQADPGTGTGTVAETIDAGGYIYLRLEQPDMWIATAPLAVSTGDQVRFSGGTEMKNFYSKSLDRTFESIFFVQNVGPLEQAAEKTPNGAVQSRAAHHAAVPDSDTVKAPAPGDIPQLDDGKSIAEIFAEAAQLIDQPVSLHAKVMKVSQKIMGKNWITLQDGTGAKPDNKVMATSSELVSVGDLVIARGTLKKDVDIGAGYQYKVLLEDATFTPSPE